MGSRGSSFSGAAVPEIAVGEEQRVPRASNALSALLARAPLALGIVTLAAAYYGAAKIGYALEFSGPVAAVVWLPVGVGISFLYFGGIRLWPGLLIGDILANDYSTTARGLGARADGRQPARGRRGRAAPASPGPARIAVGQRSRRHAHARRDRRGGGHQRDDRPPRHSCSAACSPRIHSRRSGAPGGSATSRAAWWWCHWRSPGGLRGRWP